MTARKVHFDFNAEGTHAFCGATPREGAPALELSERRKDVDCAKCRKAMDEYDAEQNEITDAFITRIETDLAESRVIDTVNLDYRSIAERNGLEYDQVENAFNDGWLKR